MKYPVEALFSLETNRDFHWRSEPLSEELREVATAFGLERLQGASRMDKRNTNSTLHRIAHGSGTAVLRSVALAGAAAMEAQCRIANAVKFADIVKPLRSHGGTHTFGIGEHAWMAYEEIPGEIFPGRDCPVDRVLRQVLALERSLLELQPSLGPQELRVLPAATHRPESWPEFFRSLAIGAPEAPAALRAALAPQTWNLLAENAAPLQQYIEELQPMPVPSAAALTHNDLQHANILVWQDRPYFLDLEDLCLEDPAIAVSHAAFKLLRHLAYSGMYPAARVRESLVPQALELIASAGFAMKGRQELFRYGGYRIVSDIWEIADCSLSSNDDSQLYDLEKRVHNFFELHYLIS